MLSLFSLSFMDTILKQLALKAAYLVYSNSAPQYIWIFRPNNSVSLAIGQVNWAPHQRVSILLWPKFKRSLHVPQRQCYNVNTSIGTGTFSKSGNKWTLSPTLSINFSA